MPVSRKMQKKNINFVESVKSEIHHFLFAMGPVRHCPPFPPTSLLWLFTQTNVFHLLLVVGELGEACSEEYEQHVHRAERVTGSAQSRQRTTRHGRKMDRARYNWTWSQQVSTCLCCKGFSGRHCCSEEHKPSELCWSISFLVLLGHRASSFAS